MKKHLILFAGLAAMLPFAVVSASANSLLFVQEQSDPPSDVPPSELAPNDGIQNNERTPKQEKREKDEQDARNLEKAQREAAGTELPLLRGTRDERLKTLFEALNKAENGDVAKQAEREIQRLWAESGSDTIDLFMVWAAEAVGKEKYNVALDFLDNVIRLKPDYAEGWNQRATVYFLQRDFGRSIADVERTLQLEPRHFGALAGLGAMLEEYGEEEQAAIVLKRALEIHPKMESVQRRLERLEKKIARRKI